MQTIAALEAELAHLYNCQVYLEADYEAIAQQLSADASHLPDEVRAEQLNAKQLKFLHLSSECDLLRERVSELEIALACERFESGFANG